MSFKPDPSKHTEENIFICKIQSQNYIQLVLNNGYIEQSASQKHLELL